MAQKPFRLQQVLDHKRREEEAKTLELASLAAEQRRLEEGLRRLREQEELHLASLSAVTIGAIDPSGVDRALTYLDAIEASIGEQLSQVAALESRVTASREALVEILKEKQLLERLREQHAGAARQAQQRRETDQSDEMASQRHIRRMGEGA